MSTSNDRETAEAFATSWNNLPSGSVYTRAQFEEWAAPLSEADVAGKSVVELGCGNASLLVHAAAWHPANLIGVDLGESVQSARRNMEAVSPPNAGVNWEIVQDDILKFDAGEGFDVAYSIGVLHHLKNPEAGFQALLAATKPGGRFHGWVYAQEGNLVIRLIVDPIRKIASHLPWWFTKYCLATPLVVPFYLYAKLLRALPRWSWVNTLPLYRYALWIAERDFLFFRHVAFDQLVTPQTTYIPAATVRKWLADSRVDPDTIYLFFRNGNSWKFGGTRKI